MINKDNLCFYDAKIGGISSNISATGIVPGEPVGRGFSPEFSSPESCPVNFAAALFSKGIYVPASWLGQLSQRPGLPILLLRYPLTRR
jgi:hypothetical protein